MKLAEFTGPGTTEARKKYLNDLAEVVRSLRKLPGHLVTVDEHEGANSVINTDRLPTEALGDICCDGYICRHIPFSPDCQDLCGAFVLDAPCSYCENNFCPPHDTAEIVAVVDGLSGCGCHGAFGDIFVNYVFDLDGTYSLPPSGSPCIWELLIEDAVTLFGYTTEDCSGDPFETLSYDVRFRFSCNSLLPETGVHIFGRIYEDSGSIFDLFNDGEDFLGVNPWTLTNTLSCSSSNVGTGGTITFSWS